MRNVGGLGQLFTRINKMGGIPIKTNILTNDNTISGTGVLASGVKLGVMKEIPL